MNSKQSNPQGKGLVPVLQSLELFKSLPTRTRSTAEILQDYLHGALVLAAKFAFCPIPGQTYHLYWSNNAWTLSMISPIEWGNRLQSIPVAQVRLRPDYSWELTPHETSKSHPQLVDALDNFQIGFYEHINNSKPLEETLPFHEDKLSWYPRVMALGLSKSIQLSLARADRREITGQDLLIQAEKPAGIFASDTLLFKKG